MQPSIDILGFTIAEPTTTVTDYMISAVAWWFGAKLMMSASSGRAQKLWALGFLFTGAATFLGGTSHGFAPYLSEFQYFAIWKATVYAVGLSMLFTVSGTVDGSGIGHRNRALLHGINVVGFAIYAVWMISHSQFIYVIGYYVPAMIVVAVIQAWAHLDHRARSAPWLIGGVLLTLAGAIVQQSGFSIHRYFNNNDLYHVVQIAGLYLLYRGCRKLR